MPIPQLYDVSWKGKGPTVNFKKRLDGTIVYLGEVKDPLTGKYNVRVKWEQKPGEIASEFYKRVDKNIAAAKIAARAVNVKRGAELRKNATTWATKWLKDHTTEYKPREVDKFLRDYKSAWAEEVKNKGYKKIISYDPIMKGGLPAVGVSQKGKPNFIFEGFIIRPGSDQGELQYRKGFLKNKIRTNANFKKGLDNYFEYFLADKTGWNLKGRPLPIGAKDAMYWLSPDSGVEGVGRTAMFSGISKEYGDIFRKYQDKFSRANAALSKNLKILEEKLNLPKNTLKAEMAAERTALKKLFDVKQLPQELKLGYSIEHTQGLSAAIKSNNINILKAVRGDLAGMTWSRNMGLGWLGGFEKTRGQYIRDIEAGKAVTRNLDELNKLVSGEYKDIGAPKEIYKIDPVTKKLTTSRISPAITQEQRFAQYFTQLAGEEVGAKELARQINPKNIGVFSEPTKAFPKGIEIYKPQLLEFIKASPANILMTIGKTLKCPVSAVGSAEGGRIGLAAGTSLINCISSKVDKDPIGSSQKISLIEESSGAMNKVKNVARGFLGALGKFAPTAGKYGAIAAAGALAQPLVKQFMNDDPSTYLTDPDQQAAMLEELIEAQERKKPRSEILDWGHTAGTLGATAAAVPGSGAMYKYRRGLSERKIPLGRFAGKEREITMGPRGKGYGKVRAGAGVGMKLLSGMFTPAGLMATEPLRIAQKRREGESWGDIGTDPTMWMGPAFAPSMTRIATAGMDKGSLLSKSLRLGMSPAALKLLGRTSGIGLLASLGWSGRELYQDYKKKRGWFAKD